MTKYKITYSDEIEVTENPVVVNADCEESAICVADRIGFGRDRAGNVARVECVESVDDHGMCDSAIPTTN